MSQNTKVVKNGCNYLLSFDNFIVLVHENKKFGGVRRKSEQNPQQKLTKIFGGEGGGAIKS